MNQSEGDANIVEADTRMPASGAGAGSISLAGTDRQISAKTGDGSGIGKPERTLVSLGFIPLTDCAPLVVAVEKEFFAREGLEVSLSKEPSWANIRDKVALGVLDGAQMLAGIPIAASLGIGAVRTSMMTALSLDLNGNAITLSRALCERLRAQTPGQMAQRPLDAGVLREVSAAYVSERRRPMTFAVVFPVSTHNYQLRYWLAAGGIDPDRDVRIVVVPPSQMVAHLEAGDIDGYCVGEPWNEVAVARGSGEVVITGYEIWNNGPEKVLGVTRDWAENFPNTHQAMLRALIRAGQWADQPENRMEVARLIARPDYVDADFDVVKMSMAGSFRYGQAAEPVQLADFNVFHRYAAGFPWRSHALWIMTQMVRWRQLDPARDLAAAAREIYRPDIYRQAAEAVGVDYPLHDYKTEGKNSAPWTLGDASREIAMGPDLFLDGRIFDPQDTESYIRSFESNQLAGGGLPAPNSNDGTA